jgi:hypothetical protein
MCRYPIRLSSGSSGPYAENAWTVRYSGPRRTWRQSYSTSNIIIISIERTPDARDTRPYRMPTLIAHLQISVVIDGKSIVEAYTKRRVPHDFSNSPPTRFSPASRTLLIL